MGKSMQFRGENLFLKSCLVMVLIIWSLTGNTQQVLKVGNPKWKAPFVVIVGEAGNPVFSDDLLRDYQDTKGTSFLRFEMDRSTSVLSIVNQINRILNDAAGIDLRHVYLILAGSPGHVAKYQFLSESLFFPNHEILNGSDPVSEDDLRTIVNGLSKKYLWDIRLDQIKDNNVSDLRQNATQSGISFNTSLVVPFYDGFTANLRPVFNAYGLSVYHQWSARWQIFFNLNASLNIPSRSKMQREVSAAVFGEEEEINIDILAHMYWNTGLEARYLLPEWNQKLRPYVGFQLGYSAFRVAENSIEVDPEDLSGGSITRPEGFDRIDFEEISGVNTGISTGLYYQSNPKWRADFGLKWTQDTNTGPYLHQLSLSVGLQFRFAKRKELFYNYVNYKQ